MCVSAASIAIKPCTQRPHSDEISAESHTRAVTRGPALESPSRCAAHDRPRGVFSSMTRPVVEGSRVAGRAGACTQIGGLPIEENSTVFSTKTGAQRHRAARRLLITPPRTAGPIAGGAFGFMCSVPGRKRPVRYCPRQSSPPR